MLFLFIGGRQEFFDLFDSDNQVVMLDIESGEDESEKEESDDKTFFLWIHFANENCLGKTLSSIYSYKINQYSGDFQREIRVPPKF